MFLLIFTALVNLSPLDTGMQSRPDSITQTTALSDAEAGYNQAAYDACMDSADEVSCD